MKALPTRFVSASTIYIAPAIAHRGPAPTVQNLVEHLPIAMAVSLALAFGILRWPKGPGKPGQ